MVWCRIQAMTAASARRATGMRLVRATVPLPTGVACCVMACAMAWPSSSKRGAKRRNARTSSAKVVTYARCSVSRRAWAFASFFA